MATTTTSPDAFLRSVQAKNSAPLWTVMHQLVSPRPNPKAVPTLWKYNEMRPSLIEAGEIVGAEEAERRVLMLVNPTMEPPYTTDTIYSGLQLVLPGETAPAHRHVAFALRFIIEGDNGFTAVEGQKIPMARGDVILTPPWHWHDHGNEGTDPMIWLDGLDLPLFKGVPVNFAEGYAEKRYPSEPSASSPWRFPWSETLTVLDKDKSAKPYAIYHYHRKNNAKQQHQQHLSDTISAQAERIAPGHTTTATKETCSFIYHVESGEGMSKIVAPDGAETDIHWTARDTFAVPAWSLIRHTCTSDTDAYLFAINDRPVVEALGLFRRE